MWQLLLFIKNLNIYNILTTKNHDIFVLTCKYLFSCKIFVCTLHKYLVYYSSNIIVIKICNILLHDGWNDKDARAITSPFITCMILR